MQTSVGIVLTPLQYGLVRRLVLSVFLVALFGALEKAADQFMAKEAAKGGVADPVRKRNT